MRYMEKVLKSSQSGEEGFTLTELLVVIAIFVAVIAIGSNTFTLLLKQSTQQNKQTESQVERIAGLELMRADIASAGFGLPWAFQSTFSYNEAADPSYPLAANYNDAPNGVPRAIISGNNHQGYVNGSDYLVIKGTSLGTSTAASKWTYITFGTTSPNSWVPAGGSDLISGQDQVIVIAPQTSDTGLRQLVVNGLNFSTTYSAAAFPASFSPINPDSMYLIYGVDSNPLRMPFNRVDYFISKAAGLFPSYCAPNTGELVRAYVSQSNGTLTNPLLPILDCVADLQVIFNLDMNDDGVPGTLYNDNGSQVSTSEGVTVATVQATLNNPALLSQRLKEVRVYILTHEGRADQNFSYPNSTITVGDPGVASNFNLSTTIGVGWANYRWKVQKISVNPKNLS